MGNAERYYGISVSTNQGAAVADAAALVSVQEATADAAVQSGSYVQADVASIRTLANALKAKYNTLQSDVAALQVTLKALQDSLQAASVIAP